MGIKGYFPFIHYFQIQLQFDFEYIWKTVESFLKKRKCNIWKISHKCCDYHLFFVPHSDDIIAYASLQISENSRYISHKDLFIFKNCIHFLNTFGTDAHEKKRTNGRYQPSGEWPYKTENFLSLSLKGIKFHKINTLLNNV